MNMQKSSGRILRMIEENGQVLVSFDAHDAYFTAAPEVAEALRMAERMGLSVHFTYDHDLNILGVVAHQD